MQREEIARYIANFRRNIRKKGDAQTLNRQLTDLKLQQQQQYILHLDSSRRRSDRDELPRSNRSPIRKKRKKNTARCTFNRRRGFLVPANSSSLLSLSLSLSLSLYSRSRTARFSLSRARKHESVRGARAAERDGEAADAWLEPPASGHRTDGGCIGFPPATGLPRGCVDSRRGWWTPLANWRIRGDNIGARDNISPRDIASSWVYRTTMVSKGDSDWKRYTEGVSIPARECGIWDELTRVA